ncbi:hypothetical protein DFH07DRAFT_785472 [Mycena maculata]|uniref:Uncharacterized protein n=1 Tax=Mycena maculata TaxID=230809 RepID=A0AAD7HA47_9AGAR|nr:hypothetical protein DFH07DRAFT_785472 [Mycena maculata]
MIPVAADGRGNDPSDEECMASAGVFSPVSMSKDVEVTEIQAKNLKKATTNGSRLRVGSNDLKTIAHKISDGGGVPSSKSAGLRDILIFYSVFFFGLLPSAPTTDSTRVCVSAISRSAELQVQKSVVIMPIMSSGGVEPPTLPLIWSRLPSYGVGMLAAKSEAETVNFAVREAGRFHAEFLRGGFDRRDVKGNIDKALRFENKNIEHLGIQGKPHHDEAQLRKKCRLVIETAPKK